MTYSLRGFKNRDAIMVADEGEIHRSQVRYLWFHYVLCLIGEIQSKGTEAIDAYSGANSFFDKLMLNVIQSMFNVFP